MADVPEQTSAEDFAEAALVTYAANIPPKLAAVLLTAMVERADGKVDIRQSKPAL